MNLQGSIAGQRLALCRVYIQTLPHVDRCHLAALYVNRFPADLLKSLIKNNSVQVLAEAQVFAVLVRG